MHYQKNKKTIHKINPNEKVQISGAGPSGLAAAITLAQAGYKVVVHEAHHEVGFRFKQDLQGIENWTQKEDVLEEFSRLGITTDFNFIPFKTGSSFDAWDNEYQLNCNKPFFYMVERGPGAGTLDNALLNQALSLGVEVRYNSRLEHIDGPGIFAGGPKVADGLAVGYHFNTDMKNGFWIICDNKLSPKGYAYLLVMNGHGTVKSCMFSDYKHQKLYVQRTVAAFERLVGLKMINPQSHAGVDNFFIPTTALQGNYPVVGEQAGFQDNLWGFGIRIAITSGVMAAYGIMGKSDYDAAWKKTLAPLMETSLVNRLIFSALGNKGYRWYLQHLHNQADIRQYLYKQYRPSFLKKLIFPLAKMVYRSHKK